MAQDASKVITFLWYATAAEEAARFYVSVFPNSSVDGIWDLPADSTAGPAGSVKVVDFTLLGRPFQAMTAGPHHDFNDAISIVVLCDDQVELDRYWDAIEQNGGTPSACGWITDRWGLRWQITPRRLDDLMRGSDRARAARVATKMLTMVKLDVAALEAA